MLIIQWIFVGPCELAGIRCYFFFIHCRRCSRALYLLYLLIPESDSTDVSHMDFSTDRRSYSFWTLSSYWSFMIDTLARTIYDDMDGSTFKHSVNCLESLRISTRCDVPLAILGQIPLFY